MATVYLTVGRHALYEPASKYPISPVGIADTVALCPLLERQAKSLDAIYTSTSRRAEATARIFASLLGTKKVKIIRDERLNAPFGSDKQKQRQVYEDIVKQANEKQWRHVHVVTHYENVFSLLNRKNDVSYSKWIVRQADNWEKMLSDEHFAFVDVLPKRRAGVLDVVNLNAEYPRNTAIAKSGMDEDDYKLTLKVGHRLLELLSKPQDYDEVVEELEKTVCASL